MGGVNSIGSLEGAAWTVCHSASFCTRLTGTELHLGCGFVFFFWCRVKAIEIFGWCFLYHDDGKCWTVILFGICSKCQTSCYNILSVFLQWWSPTWNCTSSLKSSTGPIEAVSPSLLCRLGPDYNILVSTFPHRLNDFFSGFIFLARRSYCELLERLV